MGYILGAHISLFEPRFLPADGLVELSGGNVVGWVRGLALDSLPPGSEHFSLPERFFSQGSMQRRF